MASILKVDDLRGNTAAGDITITSEGGAATMQLQQGVIKAWCKWDNTGTPTQDDSLNVSSLTDTATGRTGLNLTNYMGSQYYAASGFGSNGYPMMSDVASANTSSVCNVMIWYGGSYLDSTIPSALITGDLA